jgi:hypothetical protein
VQKYILAAFALALAFGVAAPAFADRYDDPTQYGVEFTGDKDSADSKISLEGITSERA